MEVVCRNVFTQEMKSECFHLRHYLKNIQKETEDLTILALHQLIKFP